MSIVARILAGFVAFQHLAFLVLEMFLWATPIGLKVFKNSEEFARSSAVLAANQGLYNGFLAAGLIWAVISADPRLATFFLACVIIAGIYGAISVSTTIFFVQSVPAIAALVAVWL